MGFIELTERIETGAAKMSRKPVGVLQIEHRLSLSTEHDPFIRRRKKTAGPVSGPATGATAGGEHDIAGKVLRFAPQPVGDPRADRRSSQFRPTVMQSTPGDD